MSSLEQAALALAGANGGAEEVDKKQKLTAKFTSASNLRGILVAKDKESKAFQLLFGKMMDTEALTETLGGLGDWEDYLKNMEKNKRDQEEEDRKKRKKVFEEMQEKVRKRVVQRTKKEQRDLVEA